MHLVTLSPKYQIVIPRPLREKMRLRPGQKMQLVEYADRIELIPEQDIFEPRGLLRGKKTGFEREEDRL
jgi:AbrB family looped-hinge helix DNA binding protein